MLFFPNCKINLGLRILRRRPDGFHDLETIFYPLALKDTLEFIRAPETPDPGETMPENSARDHPQEAAPSAGPGFTAYGLPIPGDPDNNLCLKAWHLLKTDFPDLPDLHIHLYKNIPIGAGLGGGSANGAWTLTGLNRQFHLGLTAEQLLHYAARLGSDCPFFLFNTPCLGTGRGEQLQPISLDLSRYTFTLVDPGIHISTAKAFSLCTPREPGLPLQAIVSRPVGTWAGALTNDFEEPLFHLHPELRQIKETLYAQGALYTSLTGSGSSFYSIFEKHQAPAASPFYKNYNYRTLP